MKTDQHLLTQTSPWDDYHSLEFTRTETETGSQFFPHLTTKLSSDLETSQGRLGRQPGSSGRGRLLSSPAV